MANTNKYKLTKNDHILQYDSDIFVWFDEAGIVSGAAPTFNEAERQLNNYAKSLDSIQT